MALAPKLDLLSVPSSLIRKLGWSPTTSLNIGINKTYEWLIQQLQNV